MTFAVICNMMFNDSMGGMFDSTNTTRGDYCSNTTSVATNSWEPEQPLSSLQQWSRWYVHVHGYLAVVVCVFGIIANLMNIIVLIRKNMRSATNIILMAIAVTDLLVMLAYLPYALQFYVIYGSDFSQERNTKSAAKFTWFYASFTVIVHAVSIWLTVTLAIFRYIVIRYPLRAGHLCSVPRTRRAIIFVTICTTILCIPNTVGFRLFEHPTDGNHSIWYITYFKQETDLEKIVYKLNFWTLAILLKLIPSLLLSILSILLIAAMKQAERRRNKHLQGHHVDGASENEIDKRTHRTTRMLLTVIILFLITEAPHGIMLIISGIYRSFFHDYYDPLGDTFDILTLLSNCINFIIYCTMSTQFRKTFIAIFVDRFSKLTK